MKKSYKPENIYIGNKIKSYRQTKKWSQARLAEKIGVGANTVSFYEMGRISIPQAQIMKIAKALEVNHVELLPIEETKINDVIVDYAVEAKSKLLPNELALLEKLIAKTLSLDEEARKDFLKNIKFAVEFSERNEE